MQNGEVIYQKGGVIGTGVGMTNNVAEYTGLIKGLDYVNTHFLDEPLIIRGDSNLVVSCVQNSYTNKRDPHRKKPHLSILLKQVKRLLDNRPVPYVIKHVPREQNSLADKMTRIHNGN